MVKGIFIPADNDKALEIRELAKLDDYQAAVDGWIEAVDVHDLGITIYVTEEGLLRHLPFNSRASFLWWYHVPGAHQAMPVGNATIVGLPDENADSTDVPQRVIDLLTDESEYAVLVEMGGIPESTTASGSKLSSVLLPLTHWAPNWCLSCTRHDGYTSAAAWAVVMRERWSDAVETKVMRVAELSDYLKALIATLPPTE